MIRIRSLVLPLVGLAVLTGCAAEDDDVLLPESEPASAIFHRYVALGNSITAGFQSGGINDSTQALAYPVLLAAQARAEFVVPRLARPGCPPPLTAPFSNTTVGVAPNHCAGRIPGSAPAQNLAVPGATVASLSNINAAANALTTLILGGRTPIQRMLELDPTLVTAWVGNNDALRTVTEGNGTLLTPVDAFVLDLDKLVTAILQTPAGNRDAVVLLGVVDPRIAPIAQPGLFAFAAAQDPQAAALLARLGKSVDANCAPVTATGQPNPLARNLISLRILTSRTVSNVSCADDAPFVTTPAELAAISARVAEYNRQIAARATSNGWMYVDPNTLFDLGDPSQVRKCQGLATAVTPSQLQAAVRDTCPSPLPSVGFGSLVSYDGVHPSSLAHRLVANAVIDALNAKFALALPRLST